MSLPETYQNSNQYFRDALSFLTEYCWLHSFPNIEITTRNLLACFPTEWTEYFRKTSFNGIKNIGIGVIDPEAPSSLKKFMQRVKKMTPSYELEENKLELIRSKKFGEKKLHEVSYLAPMVNKLCEPRNIKYIIDIGAGCGYLSHILFQAYGYKVLGIESSQSVLESALRVQKDHYPNSIGNVVFTKYRVTADSGEDIMRLMCDSFIEYQGEDVFFVALHACADLSVHFMDLFRTIEECKGGIVMPCCYHLLEKCKFGFISFPLSKDCTAVHKDGLLDTPFFRLATQETSSRWGGLDNTQQLLQAQNLLFRNLLQEALDEEDVTCRRQIRKTGFKDYENHYTIESYAARIGEIFELNKNQKTINLELMDTIKKRVISLYYEKGDNPELLIEAFVSLQIFIQAFCENVILLDRVCYMNDFQHINCVTKKITNDLLSARCFALVLSREDTPLEKRLKKSLVIPKSLSGILAYDDEFEYRRTVRSVFK